MTTVQGTDREPRVSSDALQSVVVVGGSLSGLTFALACAHHGINTQVLEQSRATRRRGGTLGVNQPALIRAIGESIHQLSPFHRFPVLAGRRQAVAWQALHGWLRLEAQRHPAIVIEDGTIAKAIHPCENHVSVHVADGREFRANLVVGADGYRSLVRRVINPDEAAPAYAGYLLWRGLVDEKTLPRGCLPRDHEETVLINQTGHRLVAYAVAGADGSLTVGMRLLSFTWYDAGCNDDLLALGCIDGSGHVLRTLTQEDVPGDLHERLRRIAQRIWPEPWRSVITHALEHRQVFATPVAEYSPPRLARGRLAIIGDAAHVVSPVTGKGFLSGIDDVTALVRCLVQHAGGSTQDIPSALAVYENCRSPEARSLVVASQQWSRAFVDQWTLVA